MSHRIPLRADVAMQTAGGVEREATSAPTLCRLEKWANRATAWRLHEVLVEQFITSFKTGIFSNRPSTNRLGHLGRVHSEHINLQEKVMSKKSTSYREFRTPITTFWTGRPPVPI